VVYLKPEQLIIKDCARRFVLNLYRHEVSRGLFATAELLVQDSPGEPLPEQSAVFDFQFFMCRPGGTAQASTLCQSCPQVHPLTGMPLPSINITGTAD